MKRKSVRERDRKRDGELKRERERVCVCRVSGGGCGDYSAPLDVIGTLEGDGDARVARERNHRDRGGVVRRALHLDDDPAGVEVEEGAAVRDAEVRPAILDARLH